MVRVLVRQRRQRHHSEELEGKEISDDSLQLSQAQWEGVGGLGRGCSSH